MVTPFCQRKLADARHGGQDMMVFNFDMTDDCITGEVQVKRTVFYSVYANSSGDSRCRCKYRLELGMPCWHAVQLIDVAYRQTRNAAWDITLKKWSLSYISYI